MLKRLLLVASLIFASGQAFASDCWNNTAATQTDCGQVNMYLNGSSQSVPVSAANPLPVTGAVTTSSSDPCASNAKSSAAINIVTTTTTSIVAVSGSTAVYVCGFSISLAPSATSADIAAFVYGTGAACVSGQTSLTGAYGNGDLTSAAAVVPINYGNGGATIFKAPASNGVCIVSSGTAVNIQGVLTYVQQ
jgi:hypothetical protein